MALHSGHEVMQSWAADHAAARNLRIVWITEGARLPGVGGKPSLLYRMTRLAYRWPGAVRVDHHGLWRDDREAVPPLVEEADFERASERNAFAQLPGGRAMAFGGSGSGPGGLTAYQLSEDPLDPLRGAFRTPWLAARWLADQTREDALRVERESDREVVAVLGGILRVTLRLKGGQWRCEEAALIDDAGEQWVVRFDDFREVEGLRPPQPFLRTERRRTVAMPGQPLPPGDPMGPERASFATTVEVVDRLDDSVFILTEEEATKAAETSLGAMRAQAQTFLREKAKREAQVSADPARAASEAAATPAPPAPPAAESAPSVVAPPTPTMVKPEPTDAAAPSGGGRLWYLSGVAMLVTAVGLLIWRSRRG